jgi:hypothetical protein
MSNFAPFVSRFHFAAQYDAVDVPSLVSLDYVMHLTKSLKPFAIDL